MDGYVKNGQLIHEENGTKISFFMEDFGESVEELEELYQKELKEAALSMFSDMLSQFIEAGRKDNPIESLQEEFNYPEMWAEDGNLLAPEDGKDSTIRFLHIEVENATHIRVWKDNFMINSDNICVICSSDLSTTDFSHLERWKGEFIQILNKVFYDVDDYIYIGKSLTM